MILIGRFIYDQRFWVKYDYVFKTKPKYTRHQLDYFSIFFPCG